MEETVLDIDIDLFQNKTTIGYFVTKIVESQQNELITAEYTCIDEDHNVLNFTEYYDANNKTYKLLDEQIRAVYKYLLYLNNPAVMEQLDTDILEDLHREKVLNLASICLSLVACPFLSYALVHYNDNPTFYSVVILLAAGKLISGAKKIPLVNEIKARYAEILDKIDRVFFMEGEKLCNKERKLK